MTKKLPPSFILDRFSVSEPELVAETALANVWRVRRPSGEAAALKIYHGADMLNEAPGLDLLAAWNGEGAAKLYDRAANAALIEWLDGPSLGDLTRSGEDDKAGALLVEAANKLHSTRVRIEAELPRLESWFGDLLTVEFGPDCPASARWNMARARSRANELLATERDIAPLHGDLQHDNVRLGPRGYCAFDAKGVLGEKTYELANAFRNPPGAREIVADPLRVDAMARLWSGRFNVDERRLLNWAAAKCALSIAWRSDGALGNDAEFDLLEVLLDAANSKR